jgi:hypothetical protein
MSGNRKSMLGDSVDYWYKSKSPAYPGKHPWMLSPEHGFERDASTGASIAGKYPHGRMLPATTFSPGRISRRTPPPVHISRETHA